MSKKTKILLVALACLLVIAAAAGVIAWQTGMFDKPVQPDNRWTLRNLTIDTGEEEYALAPEVRLRAVESEGRSALEFEIASGEKLLLPVRGEITAEGVNFALGGSGRVYTANEALVQELLGQSEVDAEMTESITKFIENYFALLKKSADADFIRENADMYGRMYEIMLDSQRHDTTVEVNGKKYEGALYRGTMTAESIGAMMEYMRTCEVEEIAGMMDGMLEIMGMVYGKEAASYEDMMALLGEEGDAISADVELTVVMNKKMQYQKMTMKQDGEATGMAIDTTAESITTPKGTTMTMQQSMGDPETNGTVMTMDMEIEGAQTAPTAIHFAMNYDSAMDYSDEDYTSAMAMGADIVLDGAKTDGLWNLTLDTDINTDTTFGFGEQVETTSDIITIDGSYAETAEEDGSITGAFSLKAGDGSVDFGLGFDLNRGKDAVVAELTPEGTQTHVLSADLSDEAGVLLMEDVTALLTEDIAELSADESIAALVEEFSVLFAPAEELTEEYVYDESIEMVERFEEAAAIYTGAIPDYTAPAGYELDMINVSDYALEAVYDNGEIRFTYSLMDFGMDLGVEPEAAYTDDGEGNIYYAELFLGSSYVIFSFEDAVPQADAEAIVAGLGL